MTDPFDDKEPCCPLSEGAPFYDPGPDAPRGQIPIARILAKLDACFAENDTAGAGRLLDYWLTEAKALYDERGELEMENERIGHFRKMGMREEAYASAARARALLASLGQEATVSGATVLLNCATAYKAFGEAERALPLYLRAESIFREKLPEGDARHAGLANNMALALVDLGRYAEAEASYRRALSIMASIPGGGADAAITHINMAHLYEAAAAPERIADCILSASICLTEDALPHDGYYAFVCEKCAPSFRHFGYPDIADELLREAKEIYERA